MVRFEFGAEYVITSFMSILLCFCLVKIILTCHKVYQAV